MAKKTSTTSTTSTPSSISPTIRHILDNVLITKSRSEDDRLIVLVRPDFSIRINCPGLLPNSSPARVELDIGKCELRVWIDDLTGESRPNRVVRNAFVAKAHLLKVKCAKCGSVDIESFIGNVGQNGWLLDAAKSATCPDCRKKSGREIDGVESLSGDSGAGVTS
jgi:hypothetical protein